MELLLVFLRMHGNMYLALAFQEQFVSWALE